MSSTNTQQEQEGNVVKSLSETVLDDDNNDTLKSDDNNDDDDIAILTLQDITDMENIDERSSSTTIPKVKFITDISEYISSFLITKNKIITTELLIGAYTQLHTKYKLSETSLLRKQEHLKDKVPELEKSLSLVQSLQMKKQQQQETDGRMGIVRYNIVDSIYAKAHVDYSIGIVYLWLGANVMVEYTYDEAIQFLQSNLQRATTELLTVTNDISFVRDQIVTTEVNISRIYNYDVRRKRNTNQK